MALDAATAANFGPSLTRDTSFSSSSVREEDDQYDVEAGAGGQQKDEIVKPSNPVPPRLVPRNLPFHQSKNRIAVGHARQGLEIFRLLKHDYFHVLLRLPTSHSLPFLLGVWTLLIIIFAGFYQAVDYNNKDINCGLGPPGEPLNFAGCFAFSLETCTTVGYGLPGSTNAFFENCPSLQVTIYFQMTWSMMFNAFLFAFFFSRIAKCDARGVQVVFSKTAVVSVVNNQVRLQARLYDVDAKHPVVEAHVRLYAVMKDRPVPRPLRVLQPNDDFGAMLFLSWPTVVSHHVDLYSLLHPHQGTPVLESGLNLRQVDSATANREDVVCPTCGESYGTYERWIQHVRYQQVVERMDHYPVQSTHLQLTDDDIELYKKRHEPITDIQVLKQYFEQHVSEVISVVEGIDPLMSGTFQALQSYRFEDIVWDEGARFAPCLEHNGNSIAVDLSRFHETEVVNIEKEVSPPKTTIRQRRQRTTAATNPGQRSARPHDSFVMRQFFEPPSRKEENGVEATTVRVEVEDSTSTKDKNP